jgi:hypothetical protein
MKEMLNGFRKETQSPSEEEKVAAIKLTNAFNKFPNVYFTEGYLSTQLYETYGYNISGARFRKCISYIRLNKMVDGLIADNNGYKKSTNRDEIIRYKESLKQRIMAIKEVYDSIDIPEEGPTALM